jgi:hypothetical protein
MLIYLISLINGSLTIILWLDSTLVVLHMTWGTTWILTWAHWLLFLLLRIIKILIIISALRSTLFHNLSIWNILFSWLIRSVSSEKVTRFLPVLNIRTILNVWNSLILLLCKMLHQILILWSYWCLRMYNIIILSLISLIMIYVDIQMLSRIRRIRLHLYIVLL